MEKARNPYNNSREETLTGLSNNSNMARKDEASSKLIAGAENGVLDTCEHRTHALATNNFLPWIFYPAWTSHFTFGTLHLKPLHVNLDAPVLQCIQIISAPSLQSEPD